MERERERERERELLLCNAQVCLEIVNLLGSALGFDGTVTVFAIAPANANLACQSWQMKKTTQT